MGFDGCVSGEGGMVVGVPNGGGSDPFCIYFWQCIEGFLEFERSVARLGMVDEKTYLINSDCLPTFT